MNLGASTIPYNYDGLSKHRTKIGDGVHTGVHAPRWSRRSKIGDDDADTGARSVVTHDVAPGRHVRGIPAHGQLARGWLLMEFVTKKRPRVS